MSEAQLIADLKATIKSYPDYPKKGIIFRDFFPILQSPKHFEEMISLFEKHIKKNDMSVDCIVGLESRGFLIGPPLALKLGIPFVPIRKSGKLPGIVKKEFYSLEYGSDAFEIQVDAIKDGEQVVIVDDLLATGGSMEAAVKLVRSVGGIIKICMVVIELEELKGHQKVSEPSFSLFKF